MTIAVPNRISIDENDPGHKELVLWRSYNPGRRIIVTVDRKEIHRVQTASVVEGFVIYTKTDAEGRPMVDYSNPEDPEWIRETVQGEVRFFVEGDPR